MKDKKLKILIVEDDPIDAELIVRHLAKAKLNFTKRLVDTKDGFIRAIKNFQPDLILSDSSVGGFKSLEALELAQKEYFRTQFILVTGNMGEDIAAECIRKGAADFVLKDNLARLVPAIRRAMAMAKERTRLLEAEKEKIKAEEELKKANKFLSLIIESAPVTIFLCKPSDGYDVLYIGSNVKELTGYEAEEFISNNALWSGNIHPEDAGKVFDEMAKIHEKNSIKMEYRWRSKDGSYKWFYDNMHLVKASDRTLLHIARVWQDITERVLMEENLKKSEESYRQLYNTAPVGYHELDRAGRIVRVNETEAAMLGYSIGEMLGRPFFDFIAPEEKEITRDSFDEIMSGRIKAGSFERNYIHKDGTILDLIVKTNLVYGEDGRISGARATLQDITERKKAENARLLLEAAIEQAAEYILITDTEGSIQYANPTFETITGYKREEAFGKNPRILKSGLHDVAFYKELWETIKGGRVWKGRFSNRKKDGTLYHEEATISPVKDAAGRITNFVAVKRDITQELELENQIIQTQKIESIGLLAGGVAHDFNNILTTVMGYSSMMARDQRLPEKFRIRSGEIVKAAQRGADIAKQLLTFSRKRPPKLEPMDLNELIKQSLNFLKQTIGPAIPINTAQGQNLHLIEADSTQVQQILLNLAVNARDAMPGGGKIVIRTENIEIDPHYVQNHLDAKPGPFVLLTFSDSGCGMDRETQKRIFEPFFTTKEVGKGTGLGLSVVYGIVKSHKGLVHVYSELGRGTTFKVYFPRSARSASEAVKDEAQVKGGSETVLVVDDEVMILNLVTSFLEDYGYKCLTAENGAEALEVYRANQAKIALVLLDIVMPKMGGPEAFERIKDLNPEVRVIMSSGFSVQDEAEMSKTGVKAFVSKPYQARVLAQKVREVLDQEKENMYSGVSNER